MPLCPRLCVPAALRSTCSVVAPTARGARAAGRRSRMGASTCWSRCAASAAELEKSFELFDRDAMQDPLHGAMRNVTGAFRPEMLAAEQLCRVFEQALGVFFSTSLLGAAACSAAATA